VTGNVQGGNLRTVGLISAAGNVLGGNLIAGGNVEAGNILTTGTVSATGNITGNYILGNGSQLTGVAGGNSFSPIVVSGQSNVTANSSATALTYVAGYGVLLSTDNTAKSITYALSPFAVGGSFGTVTESATSTMDLGLITEAVTVSYDLGNIGATGASGTVTSITAGTGLSGGIITTSGTIAIDSTVTTNSGTQTLTNKRVNPRAVAAGATSGTLTPNGDTTDVFNAFGLTGAITVATPSGTPVDGQRLMLRFEDDGTGRGITWTTSSGAFRAVGVTLPATTVATKITYVGCVYNSTDIFWDVIAVATQA
jgi:hypothetical protein